MVRGWSAIIVAGLLCPAIGQAQSDRYELGLRLRAFEANWMATPAGDARNRTVPPLKKVIEAFFSARVGEVARQLDIARAALRSTDAPSPAKQWAETIAIELSGRLFDPTNKPELVVKLRSYYDSKLEPPTGLVLRYRIGPPNAERSPWREAKFTGLPMSFTTALPDADGDWQLTVEVRQADTTLAERVQTLSLVPRLTDRLTALATASEKLPADKARTTDRTTLRNLRGILEALAAGSVFETDYPAARLIAEAESVLQSLNAGQSFYGPQRAGQFWLTLPVGASSTAAVRLLVPEKLSADKPVPLVVALHGAGGSENLFFEGYGSGAIVKECAQRGWLLVAPRAGTFITAAPVAEIVAELSKLYPVDAQRVYLVGHSMGAAQTVAAVQAAPGKYAAAAALGGGGGVRKLEAFKGLPLFVGVGSEDFALGGARGLAKAVEKGEGVQVTLKEYPQVEHMMIVPVALKEVFAFFEKHPAAK